MKTEEMKDTYTYLWIYELIIFHGEFNYFLWSHNNNNHQFHVLIKLIPFIYPQIKNVDKLLFLRLLNHQVYFTIRLLRKPKRYIFTNIRFICNNNSSVQACFYQFVLLLMIFIFIIHYFYKKKSQLALFFILFELEQ